MMATASDDNFDWVSAQAGCCAEQMFQKLQDGAAVTFALDGPRINIDGDGVDVRVTAVVGINPAGECRYFVGELEFLGWEVREQGLDQLFFEDADE